MDPQQELFSAILTALRTEYKDAEIGIYDVFLPPDGTPYPFIYLADNQQIDQSTKTCIIGSVHQTIHVWHNDPWNRGTVSRILSQIKNTCRMLRNTKHFAWDVRHVEQRILSDSTTKQPLLHGILEVEFSFS